MSLGLYLLRGGILSALTCKRALPCHISQESNYVPTWYSLQSRLLTSSAWELLFFLYFLIRNFLMNKIYSYGVLCGGLVRVFVLFFRRQTPNLKVSGSTPRPSLLLIWISPAVYNLQCHQRPVALIPCLYGVRGLKDPMGQ